MGLCIFNASEVGRCIKHAMASDKWSMGWSEEKPQPALHFVHDNGVYCMSNGDPRDLIADGSRAFTAHAEGCNPHDPTVTFDDWWNQSRLLVGGDDFVETIPVDATWLERCESHRYFCIDVRDGDMEIYFDTPIAERTVSK